MTKLPAADLGSSSSSAFQRELERARRHLAKLEAEQQQHIQPVACAEDVRFDESPALAKACNMMIWAVVLAPFILALVVLARRLIG